MSEPDDRRDRQVAAGWLLGLIILGTPTLVVVPPRFDEIPLLISAAFLVAVAVAIVAAVGLFRTVRGGGARRAPMLAAVSIAACIALATTAGVLSA